MEAVTQTARAARRYLGVLLSGDDAARKQLVFSPGRVSNRADVGASEPARDCSDVSGSRARASAPRSASPVARVPAEGADAPRAQSRFAAEAAKLAGERARPETEAAKTSDRAGAASRVVAEDRGARARGDPASVGTARDDSLRERPVGACRSILAVRGSKRKRDGEETPPDAARSRDFPAGGSGGPGGPGAPAAVRRRLELLRSVGVVKRSGGVLSTYDLGARGDDDENDRNVFSVAASSERGRVKLAVRGRTGRIRSGVFRAGAIVARGRRRFRAVATDPNVVRAELVDLPPDDKRVDAAPAAAALAAPAAVNASEDGAAAASPPAFSFAPATAATPSLAIGAGSTRRSKSRKGREDDDESLLGAALRDFNGGKTSAREDARGSTRASPPSAIPKREDPPGPTAFTFGAPTADAAGGGATSASAPNAPAPASAAFTFGAAPAGAVAAPASAAASAPFAFGAAAPPPGGGMSLGQTGPTAAPTGRRAVRARRPGRR